MYVIGISAQIYNIDPCNASYRRVDMKVITRSAVRYVGTQIKGLPTSYSSYFSKYFLQIYSSNKILNIFWKEHEYYEVSK